MAEATRLHLIADVPVGAFLSGGIDSGVVVAAVGRRRRRGRSRPSRSASARRRSASCRYARQVAERFGTRHVEEIVTPDAAALVDELTYYFDEPFADSSAIPTFLVARLAARGVKVALSGDGGDEAFGGYARYAHDLAEARPAPPAAGVVPPRGAGAAGAGLAQGRLAAPAPAGQDPADEPGAGRPRRLRQHACRCAARRCGGGCWPPTWRPGWTGTGPSGSSGTPTTRPRPATPWPG